jgi:hypothetical protein
MSRGSRKRSSTTPNAGMAKLKGSKAKNPKASVAGRSQVGRFGWRNAAHKSRASLPASRHSLKILRMVSSVVVGDSFGPRSMNEVPFTHFVAVEARASGS